MECIEKNSMDNLLSSFRKMTEFQRTHNELKDDICKLYELVNANIANIEIVRPLIRSCYKELFSLIEADLYLINQFNPYDDYSDSDKLIGKFKKTYRHHSVTFKKQKLNKKYQSSSFKLFLQLKIKRDEFTHPKERNSLQIAENDLKSFYEAFNEYIDHINALMRDIGYSTQIPVQKNRNLI
jgi:hypothetical protein